MKINPNHPITALLDDEFMHKIAAVLVMKAGGSVEVSPDDVRQLAEMFDGEVPTLVTHAKARTIEFRLVRYSEALELARKHGGLPV